MNGPKSNGGVSHKGSPNLSDNSTTQQEKVTKPAAAKAKKAAKKKSSPRVKKSPVKVPSNTVLGDDADEVDEVPQEKRCDHSDEERMTCDCQLFVSVDCPCGDWSIDGRESIQCPACYHWLHHDCVGLNGLSKEDVKKLTSWTCYSCWSKTSPIAPSKVVPDDIPGLEKREAGESTLDDIMDEMTVLKSQLNELKLMSTGRGRSPSDCNTMKVMMKEVMHAEQVPIIIAVVKEEVEKGVTKIAGNVKEQVDAKTKLWTDLFNKKSVNDKDMFDSALMKAATEHTKKTSIAISDEGHQKDERSRNIVIRGVPESESTVNEERYAHDIKFLVAEAGMLKTDIVRCYRVGSKNPDKRKEREKNGKSPHRALIVELPSMDSVMSHTNNGSGFKFEIERDGETEVYWINKDLTPAQQLAGFRARSAKSRRD